MLLIVLAIITTNLNNNAVHSYMLFASMLASPSYNNSRCVYIYIFICLYFSCPPYCVYRFKYLRK